MPDFCRTSAKYCHISPTAVIIPALPAGNSRISVSEFIQKIMFRAVIIQILISIHSAFAAVLHDPYQFLLMQFAVEIIVRDLISQ